MTAGFARAACRALCTAAVWAAVTPASAQNEQDLLRYSYLETTGGSFRYMGLGGAGVALGAVALGLTWYARRRSLRA